jgi:hypothetical protein
MPVMTAAVIFEQAARTGRHVSAVVPAERRRVLLPPALCCWQCRL